MRKPNVVEPLKIVVLKYAFETFLLKGSTKLTITSENAWKTKLFEKVFPPAMVFSHLTVWLPDNIWCVICFVSLFFCLLRLNGAPGEVFKPNSTAHDIGQTESLVRKNISANSLSTRLGCFRDFPNRLKSTFVNVWKRILLVALIDMLWLTQDNPE